MRKVGVMKMSVEKELLGGYLVVWLGAYLTLATRFIGGALGLPIMIMGLGFWLDGVMRTVKRAEKGRVLKQWLRILVALSIIQLAVGLAYVMFLYGDGRGVFCVNLGCY